MKLVILAGGRRSTLSEVGEEIPKPMVEIGDRPLIWHIMKHASLYGIQDFVICGGYKVDVIKEYFQNFYLYQSDVEINTESNEIKILNKKTENWKISVINTGLNVSPAQRVLKIKELIDGDFCVTYGDCLSDISYGNLIDSHIKSDKIATMAIAHPSGRNTTYDLDQDGEIKLTESCKEKQTCSAWMSAGVFAFKMDIFQHLDCSTEIENILLANKKTFFSVYKHETFFQTIETVRDKMIADRLWNDNQAPWMEKV